MKSGCASALAAALLLLPAAVPAKVDLVTIPQRERVQLTIYNSADITLARDWRELTMKRGENRLQFSWANTLIDPTSLLLIPRAQAGKIAIGDLTYPPRVTGLGVWQLDSEVSGKVPFEISYFTSGVSWRAYYLATLTPDEDAVRLEGYVRVNNASGEDYENAETRLIVGRIHLLDEIAELARRQWPYGRPGSLPPPPPSPSFGGGQALKARGDDARTEMVKMAPKEIKKEGLSEYFLYTIAGTESIPSGWGKRLISFTAEKVPVTYLYRYEEERSGSESIRFLAFANDEAHKLGKEPIPDGAVKVFRRLDDDGHLSFLGARDIKYVPKGAKVELELGPSGDILVRPVEMDYSTENYEFSEGYEITGWDELHTVKVELANYRPLPARVVIRRSFPTTSWELENEGDFGTYEKVDADTVEYSLELPPNARRSFVYRALWYMGSRKR